jgi:hypothetical protein
MGEIPLAVDYMHLFIFTQPEAIFSAQNEAIKFLFFATPGRGKKRYLQCKGVRQKQ